MTLTPGTKLGPYEIVAPLGAGGMGEVFRARDARLGRDVAIKALPAAFAADAERLARFRREAQALASLNHPNIATLYGLEEVDGAPFLVLELVEGETLAERLTRGPLAPADLLKLGARVAAAMEAAHERGIVHRDLKPGNIMLTAAGEAKVLDFGLARQEAASSAGDSGDLSQSPTQAAGSGATLAGAILGTAAYMSPEQARGKPVDRRSDVWSFGCVLYEACAGRAAFSGETVSDLIARILEREPDWNALPAGTPPRLTEILRRCLRRDADARPRDMRDVRIELEELAAGGGRGSAAREDAIAVLPFINQSGPDDEYFADGVTDEILNALAQVEGLRVAARTSCFAFKGRGEDLRTVGQKLDVAHVLEGTVRRAGARLRITAQLVNVADGYQLWSERYDREMTDVFAVQDEIAGAIAARLRGARTPTVVEAAGARRGTASLEAYELFLQGRRLLWLRGNSILQAIERFERALELDPDYAEAMALLADAYRLTGTFGVAPFGEAFPRARALAERSLALSPHQAEAWATLASVAAQYDRDLPRAEEAWRRALALEPRHVRTRGEQAMWAFGFGALTADAAVALVAGAAADDPLNAWVGAIHCFVLGMAGRYPDAVREGERAVAVDPDSFVAQWMLLQAVAGTGDEARALAMVPRLLSSSGRHTWALGTLAWLRGRSGRPDMARAVYDEMEARARFEQVGPFWLAAAAAASGLADLALDHARRAVAERDPMAVLLRHIPHWDNLRADPRLAEVVRGVWG